MRCVAQRLNVEMALIGQDVIDQRVEQGMVSCQVVHGVERAGDALRKLALDTW